MLGVLDLNNPKPSTHLWNFKPEEGKHDIKEVTEVENEFEDDDSIFEEIKVDPKMMKMEHSKQKKMLHRHPSQEDFLSRQFHHGTRPSTAGDATGPGLVHKRWKAQEKTWSTWTRKEAHEAMERERQQELAAARLPGRAGGKGEWDGLMDSVNIFESALDVHTKQRNKKYHRKKSVNLRFPRKPQSQFPFTKWVYADDPRRTQARAFLAQLKMTNPRRPVDRPQTSPHELLRQVNATVARPNTTEEDVVNVTMRLKHMGF